MLTKNFYSYMRAFLQKSATYFTMHDGTKKHLSIGNNYSDPPFVAMSKWASANAGRGVSFGTGTTPATVSDHHLESGLDNTKINVTSPSAVVFSQGDTFDEYSVSFGVTNITANDITISEVALYSCASDSSYTYSFLVDRTTLDAPVTIPANETKHIAYTIRFNYGGAV